MSTKIHHGYRLAAGVDVFDFQTRLREVMGPVRDRLEAADLMRAAVTAVDIADLVGKPRPARPLVDALNGFDDRQHAIAKEGYFRAVSSREFDPYSFEVAFGADSEHEGGPRVLCLLFAEDNAYREVFEQLPEVEEYAFWDNTDQPGHVTDAEWVQRRDAWGRVVGDRPPVETMLTLKLRGLYSPSMLRLVGADRDDDTAALLAAAAPAWETRVNTRLEGLIANQMPRTEPVDLSRVWSTLMTVARVVHSDAADDVALLADLRHLTEAVLAPDAAEWVLDPADGAVFAPQVSRAALQAEAARVHAALCS